MPSYTATLDGGQGGDTTIEADDFEQAWQEAVDWAKDGDWGNEPEDVYARLTVAGTKKEKSQRVLVRAAEEADELACPHKDGHDWHDTEPGTWSLGGLRMVFTERCSLCSMLKRITKDDQPGQEMRRIEYVKADGSEVR